MVSDFILYEVSSHCTVFLHGSELQYIIHYIHKPTKTSELRNSENSNDSYSESDSRMWTIFTEYI